jgi:hypothetical protein
MSQNGPALFQEPDSFKKVQYDDNSYIKVYDLNKLYHLVLCNSIWYLEFQIKHNKNNLILQDRSVKCKQKIQNNNS